MENIFVSLINLVPLITAITGFLAILIKVANLKKSKSYRLDVISKKSFRPFFLIGVLFYIFIIYTKIELFKRNFFSSLGLIFILAILSAITIGGSIFTHKFKYKKVNIIFSLLSKITEGLFGLAMFTMFLVVIIHTLMTYQMIVEIEKSDKLIASIAMEFENENIKTDALFIDAVIGIVEGEFDNVDLKNTEKLDAIKSQNTSEVSFQFNKVQNDLTYEELLEELLDRDKMAFMYVLAKSEFKKVAPGFLILIIIITWATVVQFSSYIENLLSLYQLRATKVSL